jgi:hypothetical protein
MAADGVVALVGTVLAEGVEMVKLIAARPIISVFENCGEVGA